MFTIGKVSELSGVHIETIRYYERVGLTPRADRGRNGRRAYDVSDGQRLAFIRHARNVGFDINAIRSLLALRGTPTESCSDASVLAKAQLNLVEQKIAQLSLLRQQLRRMILTCRNGAVADCQIMDGLFRTEFVTTKRDGKRESHRPRRNARG